MEAAFQELEKLHVFKPNDMPKKCAIALVPLSSLLVCVAAIASMTEAGFKPRPGLDKQAEEVDSHIGISRQTAGNNGGLFLARGPRSADGSDLGCSRLFLALASAVFGVLRHAGNYPVNVAIVATESNPGGRSELQRRVVRRRGGDRRLHLGLGHSYLFYFPGLSNSVERVRSHR